MDANIRRKFEEMLGTSSLPPRLVRRYESALEMLKRCSGTRSFSAEHLAMIAADWREAEILENSGPDPILSSDIETLVPGARVKVRYQKTEREGTYIERCGEKRLKVKVDGDDAEFRRLNPNQILGILVNA